MQVEVVFFIAGTGADLLTKVFRGNRGRLRRQGVHMADAACPALLRRHHAAIAGVVDAGLAVANAQTQNELADKGVRRLVFVHEFAVPLQVAAQQSNAAALAQHMQDALVRILAGFDQARTTVHLYAEQSENIAVRFCWPMKILTRLCKHSRLIAAQAKFALMIMANGSHRFFQQLPWS